MKPLDVLEWLQGLALVDDFAREALEIVENDCTGAYWEIREALEKEVAPKEFKDDEKLLDHFIDRSQLLDELADTLDKAGFKGDVSNALDNVLAELTDLRETLVRIEDQDASAEIPAKLEYDL